MAQRLQVSDAWLSRYLELARLPSEVIGAFGSPHVIGISHGAALAPLLRSERTRKLLVPASQALLKEQEERRAAAEPLLPPVAIVQRLQKAAKDSSTKGRAAGLRSEHVVRDRSGAVLMRSIRAGRGGEVTLTLPSASKLPIGELLGACKELFKALGVGQDK